jgi:hypothetical protein
VFRSAVLETCGGICKSRITGQSVCGQLVSHFPAMGLFPAFGPNISNSKAYASQEYYDCQTLLQSLLPWSICTNDLIFWRRALDCGYKTEQVEVTHRSGCREIMQFDAPRATSLSSERCQCRYCFRHSTCSCDVLE